jgi:hypothetical protein
MPLTSWKHLASWCSKQSSALDFEENLSNVQRTSSPQVLQLAPQEKPRESQLSPYSSLQEPLSTFHSIIQHCIPSTLYPRFRVPQLRQPWHRRSSLSQHVLRGEWIALDHRVQTTSLPCYRAVQLSFDGLKGQPANRERPRDLDIPARRPSLFNSCIAAEPLRSNQQAYRSEWQHRPLREASLAGHRPSKG